MKPLFIFIVCILSLVNANAQVTKKTAVQKPVKATLAEMKFDKPTFNFGTIPQNVPVSHTFSFTNTGKEPLIISNVVASCGCTTPEWPKAAIAPGKKGSIKATFNAASPGAFNKTITITSNAKSSSTVINFVGDVHASAPTATKAVTEPVNAAAPKKN